MKWKSHPNKDIFYLKGKEWELKQIKSQGRWARGVYLIELFNIEVIWSPTDFCNDKIRWTWDFPKVIGALWFVFLYASGGCDGLKSSRKASEAGRRCLQGRHCAKAPGVESSRQPWQGQCGSRLQTGKLDFGALIRHVARKWHWHSMVLC